MCPANDKRDFRAELRAVFQAAVDAIVIIDHRGQIEEFSGAAEKVFGYTEQEMVGQNVSVLMPEPYRAEHDGYIHKYLQTGEARIIGIGREAVARRKDGSVFPAEISVGEIDRGGEPPQFLGIVRDVTERKQAQTRLQRREELLRCFVENVPAPVAMLDRDFRYLWVSPRWIRDLGGEMKKAIGRLQSEVMPEFHEHWRPALARCLEGHIEGKEDDRLLRGDTVEHFRWEIHPWRDDYGHIGGVVIFSEVTSERKKAQAVTRDLRERLSHVGRVGAMGEMATAMAHELNQPLTAIASYAQAGRRLIETGEADMDELIRVYERVEHQAHRAGDIIRHLRAFVRRDDSARSMCDINTLVADVVELVNAEARQKGIGIKTRLAVNPPQVLVDAIQIQQVILNLIRNGIEATMSKGSPPIEVRTMQNDNGQVQVEVQDRGEGLGDKDAAEIFDAYFTTKSDGMGLGLSLCRTLIEAHGGKLWFTENPEKGLTFRFTLPVRKGERSSGE